MEMKKGIKVALDLFERRMNEKITSGYSELIKVMNECLNQALQLTIHNAESLESYLRIEITNLVNEISDSKNVNTIDSTNGKNHFKSVTVTKTENSSNLQKRDISNIMFQKIESKYSSLNTQLADEK